MDGQVSEEEIQEALRLLASDKDYERRAGAERLRYMKWDTPDQRVVQKLKEVAQSDPSQDVRSSASVTLQSWEAPPVETEQGPANATLPVAVPPAVKRRNFLIGFLGWYLVNGALWFILSGATFDATEAQSSGAVCFLFPLNLLLPVLFGVIRVTRWLALGILAALALNFLVSLILGMSFNGLCFVPFFFDTSYWGF